MLRRRFGRCQRSLERKAGQKEKRVRTIYEIASSKMIHFSLAPPLITARSDAHEAVTCTWPVAQRLGARDADFYIAAQAVEKPEQPFGRKSIEPSVEQGRDLRLRDAAKQFGGIRQPIRLSVLGRLLWPPRIRSIAAGYRAEKVRGTNFPVRSRPAWQLWPFRPALRQGGASASNKTFGSSVSSSAALRYSLANSGLSRSSRTIA